MPDIIREQFVNFVNISDELLKLRTGSYKKNKEYKT